ncbi:ACT domain-containing protein [uncultured Salinisphaera sp.]|jgi:acetolactate synthase II small subunit|uniref:ACT domain-containing protein n=1 Tax=uncultured Salinisphaera sp. TaxID=359372 RepID=UPI0032B1E577
MPMNDSPLHTINCRMQPEPAALERVLQVVRKRGFAIERFGAEHEAGQLRIRLSCSGRRCPHMLRAQLNKLCGMESVCLTPSVATASNERLPGALQVQPAV